MKFVKESDIRLKQRSRDAKKGDSGKALIIGGNEDYAGCLALAGVAALMTGIDWVTVAAPEKPGWAVSALSPDLVVKKFKCSHFSEKHADEIIRLSRDFDAVLIGNGMGLKSASFARKVAQGVNKPIVIDADGIKSVRVGEVRKAVLTPHIKEFEILLENSGINEDELQKNLGSNVVLLKGRVDKIISKNKTAFNKTGNERMAVAGTGDVLAGLVLGFLAQGYSHFDSACWAAYINGKAGDRLKNKKGYSFIASDLAEEIGAIMKKRLANK